MFASLFRGAASLARGMTVGVSKFVIRSLKTLYEGLIEITAFLSRGTDEFLRIIDELFITIRASDNIADDILAQLQTVVDDVEKGIRKLDEFADGIKRKAGDYTSFSNFGEMKAHLFLETNTFTIGKNTGRLKRISAHMVKDLDAPIQKGIDGIYEFSSPPPKYVITEVKMNTKGAKGWKPKLDKKVTASGGSQMSDKWIRYNLDIEVGPVKSMEIQFEEYEKILIGVSEKSDPVLHMVDKKGKIDNRQIKLYDE